MKHFSSLLTLFILFISQTVFSQQQGAIGGEVKDGSKKAIPAASVSLILSKDSSVVKIAATDEKGKFRFENLLADSYLVQSSAIGFQTTYTTKIVLTTENMSATAVNLELKPATKTLNEVTVTAQKPLIEIKADKTVMNVASSINAVGSTAMELLQKSPGVRVDKDDNISMNGKNGVRIYIDGKPSQMDTKDLAAYLKGMPSSDIEAIEIITNPSAKYEASGNAGIINIKLNKNKNFGLNGNTSFTSSFGKTAKLNGSLGLNYRNKSVNVFGNYSYFTGEYRNRLEIFREQSNKGTLTTFDQVNKMIDHNYNHNFKIGADFFLSKKSTLGVLVNGSHISGPWDNFNNTVISSQSSKVDSILVATNRVEMRRNNFNYNVNYRFADTLGHELNVDADYGAFDSRSNSYQPNRYTTFDGTLLREKIYRTIAPSAINVASLKADYEQRFLGGKLGFGGKMSRVKSDNDYRFFNVINDQNYVDTNQTNHFIYNEDVNALYLNYNKTIKKWSFQAGVRMEHTHAQGDLIALKGESGKKVDTSYLNFFPSGGVTYNFNKSHTLGITYSRRIDRPGYQDLNPFENKLDELTFEKGNPFLRPQYTNNFQLAHTFKQFLTTTLAYSDVNDFFTQVSDTTAGSKTFVTRKNIARQQVYSINVSAPLRIKKWWNGYATISANHSQFKGKLDNGYLNQGATTMSMYMEHNFTLPKKWSTQISGFYNAAGIEGTIRSNAMWSVDLGVQKKVLGDKGNIKLSMSDIFNSMKWGGYVNFGGVNMRLYNKWETQQLKLAFTYRFGNKNVKNARERNTGLEDEQKRIKGGR